MSFDFRAKPVRRRLGGRHAADVITLTPSCAAIHSYVRGTHDWKFISEHAKGYEGWKPVITGYSLSPVELKKDFSLFRRIRLDITMTDIYEADNEEDDKYYKQRQVIPISTSWFSGWLARNKNFNRRPAKVEIGSIDDDGTFIVDDEYNLFIENITSDQDKIKVSLTDGLNITKDEDALVPKPSEVFLTRAV